MQDPNLNEEYDCIYRLYKANVGICNGVGLFGSLADLLLGGGDFKGSSGVKANLLSNFIRNYFARAFPEEDINMLTGSSVSQIPLDAYDKHSMYTECQYVLSQAALAWL